MSLSLDSGLSETTWERVRSELDYGAAMFGVREGRAAGRHALEVPLYLGSCRVGRVRCDLSDRLVEERHQVIDVISGFWPQSIGKLASSNLQFSEDRWNGSGNELIGWKQTVVWPTSLIG